MFSLGFLDNNGVLITLLVSISLIFLRYFLFAGVAFFIFYKFRLHYFLAKKIQQRFPTTKQIRMEIIYSLTSTFVFGLFVVLILSLRINGYTLIYTDLTKYGYMYLIMSLVGLIFLHDAYFYWMHRLLHRPKWFKQIHYLHHQSHNPTPWASFSFQPLEAILEFAILPIAVFIMPLHPLVLLTWSLWMITWNVVGHLGYEIFPKRFSKSIWFNWLNTPTHHNLHHSQSKGNYGLYFNFWDSWMGTNDSAYRDTFESVTDRAH
jgi:Delta7-sterol 5-desaturase